MSDKRIMKYYLICFCLSVLCLSCKKTTGKDTPAPVEEVIVYASKPVVKSSPKKVLVHVMPWFENKLSNGGVWGLHWKMNTQNPDIIDSDGKRQIASHFYPLIGPYASGDAQVIEYQLLLMKFSGIDGLLIDWPGTQNLHDYPLLVKNTVQIVSMLEKVGLSYAIVYEDQNLKTLGAADKIAMAQKDMAYLQTNFFAQPNYEKIANKPLLLNFGPQALTNPSDWTSVFSGLSVKPSFFPLWFESNEAGANAAGEFAWIPQDHLATLNSFYSNNYSGLKIASAYPGFKSFYAEGGWGGPTWTIPHDGINTFTQTLDLAIAQTNINYLQLATWNDYGEGTMIEPTKEFGYGFLAVLQQKLGVSSIGQPELEMVAKLYQLRKEKAAVPEVQKKLNQVFYYLVSLRLAEAKALLATL